MKPGSFTLWVLDKGFNLGFRVLGFRVSELGLRVKALGFRVWGFGGLGYCPHTLTVCNRPTIQGLIYPYSEYDYSTVTEWGAVSKV